jgi:hypothetical protein
MCEEEEEEEEEEGQTEEWQREQSSIKGRRGWDGRIVIILVVTRSSPGSWFTRLSIQPNQDIKNQEPASQICTTTPCLLLYR